MRALFGVGAQGACAHLTFGRAELSWFLEHAVPLAVVMGLMSLLANIVAAFFATCTNPDTSR